MSLFFNLTCLLELCWVFKEFCSLMQKSLNFALEVFVGCMSLLGVCVLVLAVVEKV